MIEVLPSAADVAAFRAVGTLTGDDYDLMLSTLDERLSRHERIGMFMDMTEFTDLTAEALAKDMRYAMAKLGQWSRFSRSAVITDKEWLKALVRIGSAMVPQVEVRTYSPDDREAAMAFVAGA